MKLKFSLRRMLLLIRFLESRLQLINISATISVRVKYFDKIAKRWVEVSLLRDLDAPGHSKMTLAPGATTNRLDFLHYEGALVPWLSPLVDGVHLVEATLTGNVPIVVES